MRFHAGKDMVKLLNRALFILLLALSVSFASYTTSSQPTGGTITYDGAYTVHTFLNNGTFSFPSGTLNATVLVVAGGGGGGKDWAGYGGRCFGCAFGSAQLQGKPIGWY